MGGGPVHEVRLIQLPVAAWIKAQQHARELRLEMERIAEHQRDQPLGDKLTPARFRAISTRLREAYGLGNSTVDDVVAAAEQEGRAAVDATFSVPPGSEAGLREMAQMMDEVDEYCRSGPYSLLATPAELKRVRTWFFQQCLTQAAGAAPTSWPDFVGTRR
jgi:hypothetical protein